jgi:hypothetical protein
MNVKKDVDEKLELVIMLNGNYCVIPILESELKEKQKFIIDCISKGLIDAAHFLSLNGYFILSKNILGFYVREPVENYASKVVKFMEKAEKQIDDCNSGDDWKAEE